jgi:hypothetical protein
VKARMHEILPVRAKASNHDGEAPLLGDEIHIPALRLGSPWKMAAWLAIALRVGLGLAAFLAVRLAPPTVEAGNWLNLLIHSNNPWAQFLSTWQRWDALWYQQIAMHGYHAGDNTVAFYPLYPLLTRLVSFPLGGHIVLAEIIVSTIAFGLAAWLLYTLARLDVGSGPALLAVLALAFFPTGFFLLAPYTEGLFLCLTMAALLFARRDQPWLAGLAGFAAALTNAQGAFLVLPLAFAYLRHREENGRWLGLGLPAAILPPCGLIAFTLYQHFALGEWRTSLAVQGNWGYHVYPPWRVLSDSWSFIAHTGDPIETLNLACIAGFTILAIVATVRLPLVYALYLWPSLALLWAREITTLSPLMSDARLVLDLFPCFILLALWLSRRPWLAAGWLVVSLMLQVVLLNDFEHWGFVG